MFWLFRNNKTAMWLFVNNQYNCHYMGYIGMCHCEGYGFQAVYSGIGYINQSVWI